MAPAAPAAAPAAVETEAAAEAATEAAPEAATEAAPVDIVDTAVAAGSFQTLVAAVQAAELVDTLKGEGPFTVFAPSDEAFAALPAGTLEQLLADPKGQLSQILLYHVVPSKVMAADVADGLEVATAQGGMVKFSIVDGAPMINDAKIVATDIAATNGVIHVIDKVILPPSDEAAATEAAPRKLRRRLAPFLRWQQPPVGLPPCLALSKRRGWRRR
ncbi:MAG: fasciclin domain-containing protein [Anaerolineales bacterium]|nr:fasciclin domain-containing protein [Anaerolineales bacterium]